MLLLLVRRHRSPCHCGSPHAPIASGVGAIAACMWACETERARGDPHACVVPRGLWSGMGTSGAGSGALSDANTPDRMFGR
jgi:hypothetical protein